MTLPIAEPATPGERDDAWVQARLGKLTASRIKDIVGFTKKGERYATREKYMFELIGERLTGMMADRYLGGPMLWGVETEPAARKAYSAAIGEIVTPAGFIDHPTIPRCGCSPDALVGEDGLAEIKCPETATHVKYLLEGVVPEDYLAQMHWQMACTGRRWNDFVSFEYRGTMPENLKVFRVRLMRDERQIAAYEKEARDFLKELSWAMERIESGHMRSEDVPV